MILEIITKLTEAIADNINLSLGSNFMYRKIAGKILMLLEKKRMLESSFIKTAIVEILRSVIIMECPNIQL